MSDIVSYRRGIPVKTELAFALGCSLYYQRSSLFSNLYFKENELQLRTGKWCSSEPGNVPFHSYSSNKPEWVCEFILHDCHCDSLESNLNYTQHFTIGTTAQCVLGHLQYLLCSFSGIAIYRDIINQNSQCPYLSLCGEDCPKKEGDTK